MRILGTLLTVALFVALAAPCHAGEVEGSDWSVYVPPGYRKMIDSCETGGG